MQRLGTGLFDAAELRKGIRRHPFLATGLGVFLGAAGGSLLLRSMRRLQPATGATNLVSRLLRILPGLTLGSLRVARATMTRRVSSVPYFPRPEPDSLTKETVQECSIQSRSS